MLGDFAPQFQRAFACRNKLLGIIGGIACAVGIGIEIVGTTYGPLGILTRQSRLTCQGLRFGFKLFRIAQRYLALQLAVAIRGSRLDGGECHCPQAGKNPINPQVALKVADNGSEILYLALNFNGEKCGFQVIFIKKSLILNEVYRIVDSLTSNVHGPEWGNPVAPLRVAGDPEAVLKVLRQREGDENSLRSQLAVCLNELIHDRRLTQTAAAMIFGIPQPHISELRNHKLSRFSSERLLRFITLLDRDVEIVIRPKTQDHVGGVVSVQVAA